MTAVEFLVEELIKNKFIAKNGDFTNPLIQQAKELEKEQIVKAAARGYLVGEDNISLEDAKLYGEEYYNETFKSL